MNVLISQPKHMIRTLENICKKICTILHWKFILAKPMVKVWLFNYSKI